MGQSLTLGAAAEVAGGYVLCENDFVTLNIYFNGIGVCDTQLFTDFFGDNDMAKLVNVSYNACGFHRAKPF